MKILWAKTDFLHPATRGGQIRTLEMLRRLHRRHEIHYVAFDDPAQPEGLARCGEYCSYPYPVRHCVPEKTSPRFLLQLAAGLFSPLPVAVSRFRSRAMRRTIAGLLARHRFDSLVCDFLFPAPNLPDPSGWVLFEHNVESVIWRRHVEQAPSPVHRLYFRLQARRMAAFEAAICRTVRRVIAVSENDAATFESLYGVRGVPSVPTGVDIGYFAPPASAPPSADLIFVGSMDWMANIDAITWFVRDILPRILERRPQTTLAIVGRRPGAGILALARQAPGITVTGTVADVRPWLHGGLVSIVPLRVGGGTRLKIYEAMAAGIPVVSTTIGAEGLLVRDGENIRIADDPAAFAAGCLALLEDAAARRSISAKAHDLVVTSASWDAVTCRFESLLFTRPPSNS